MLPHVAYNSATAIIARSVVANAMVGRDHNGEIKMSKLHKSLAMLLASGATALTGPVAFAQGGASAGPTLEEIVVTARKREESLQDIPVAVTAISAAEIANRQVNSLDDLAKFAPGLVFSKSFGRSNERPVMRGLASVLAGTNATVETGVAYFVDGVYYPGDIQTLDMAEVSRVEVIRGPQSALYGRNTYSGAINFIMKKPGDVTSGGANMAVDADERLVSGRLSGRLSNSLAGSLAVRYNKFDGQWKNQLTGKTIGDESSVDFSATLNFTPTDNTEFNLRMSHNRDRDGTRPLFFQGAGENNCAPGTRSFASYSTASIANPNQYYCGEIKARPIYLNDAPVTQPIVQLAGIPATFVGGVTATGGVYDTRQGVAFSGVNRDLDLALASFRWDVMGSGYAVAINGGTRRDDRKTGSDSDHSSVNIIGPNVNGIQDMATGASSGVDKYRDWSVETKLESPRENRVRWMVGAYHFEWEQKGYRIDFASLEGQDRPENIYDIVNNAIFGDLEADFTDRLSGSLELRKAKERKGQINYLSVKNLQAGPSAVTYDSRLRGNDRWTSTTPRVTLNFKASKDLTLYANYAKGYKPGGFNGATAISNGRPQDESFLEEESVNYEIGAKSILMDRRLTLNVALFKTDVTNMQLTTPIQNSTTGAVTSLSTNQGDGEVKGVEVEARFAATDNLTIAINYALADTKFTKGCDDFQFQLTSGGGIFNPADPTNAARNLNGQGSCSIVGKAFPLAAKNSGSIAADYSRPIASNGYRLYVNTDLSYTDKKFVQVHNLAWSGAATLLGARFGVETDQWRVGFYGRNLLNEDSSPGVTRWLHTYMLGIPGVTLKPGLPSTAIASYSLPRGFFGVARRERQIGLEASYKF